MKKLIKFHLMQDFPEQIVLPPIPTKRTVPDWFKKIPGYNEGDQTVKKCVPFLDAITSGYMLLNHVDIVLRQLLDKSLKLDFIDDKHKSLISKWPPIETHPKRQIPGSPMASFTVLKWMNPWRVETPKDYSLLFLPPLNRLDNPIIPLTGLVDTDTFDNIVNIPFIHSMLEPGGPEIIIPAGTPMCQLIPVRRDSWESKTTWLDKQELRKTKKKRQEMQKDREDWYKNYAHVRKNYD